MGFNVQNVKVMWEGMKEMYWFPLRYKTCINRSERDSRGITGMRAYASHPSKTKKRHALVCDSLLPYGSTENAQKLRSTSKKSCILAYKFTKPFVLNALEYGAAPKSE